MTYLEFVELARVNHEAGIVYHGFIDALIGGGISLLGGLFGRSDAKKRDAAAAEAAKVPQVTSHQVDLSKLVTESRAAGFNPMTILNAGGLSAYTTTSVTGHNAMAAVPTAPSFGSVLAGAASSAFDIYRQDKQVAAGRQHELDLWKMQSSAPRAQARAAGATMGSLSANPRRVTASGPVTLTTNGLGEVATPEVGEVTVTNPYDYFDVDPYTRNAEDKETRNGDNEIFTFIDGLSVQFNDLWYNVTGLNSRERRAITMRTAKTVYNTLVVDDPLKRGLPSGYKPR